ncbi:MAG: 4-hydroxy-3-methylbut-2-enyl diphosphate reductase [Candidatus Kapabacteria bacterium]|nr:4-hydroxy-3-methylbut-2-enyl diphosphate reductase [Candidatus Kapabacteria bacterium]
MIINIDSSSGFCWGVVKTIDIVENVLLEKNGENVYVLGEVIHNPKEIERLESKGLKTISINQLNIIDKEKDTLIVRAHGEPPSTFITAKEAGINVVDATCPLVIALQKRVKKFFDESYQIIIYGKKEHPEVIGLRGFCNDKCIVIYSVDEALEKVDFTKKSVLLSQTTVDKSILYSIKDALEAKISDFQFQNPDQNKLLFRDTVCKYVYDREDSLKEFARNHNAILFVAGRHSSNGKSLFKLCSSANSKTFFVEDYNEIDFSWFDNCQNIGISGATSTPQWFMEEIRAKLLRHFEN